MTVKTLMFPGELYSTPAPASLNVFVFQQISREPDGGMQLHRGHPRYDKPNLIVSVIKDALCGDCSFVRGDRGSSGWVRIAQEQWVRL